MQRPHNRILWERSQQKQTLGNIPRDMAKTDHEDVAASAACAEQGAPALQMSLVCTPDGRLQIGAMREGSYGEDNTASVANLVVAFLNDAGEQWSAPHLREGDEDGVDMVADGPKGRLRMQIVRVPSTQDHWKNLSVVGHTEASITPDGLADDLILAIRKKVARLSPGVRSITMLVLDGQNALATTFRPSCTRSLGDTSPRLRPPALMTYFCWVR